jgi:hypothetical protein
MQLTGSEKLRRSSELLMWSQLERASASTAPTRRRNPVLRMCQDTNITPEILMAEVLKRRYHTPTLSKILGVGAARRCQTTLVIGLSARIEGAVSPYESPVAAACIKNTNPQMTSFPSLPARFACTLRATARETYEELSSAPRTRSRRAS